MSLVNQTTPQTSMDTGAYGGTPMAGHYSMPDNHMNHPFMQAKIAAQKITPNTDPHNPGNYAKAMKSAGPSNGVGVGY